MTLAELELAFRVKVGDFVIPYHCSSVEFTSYVNQAESEACRRARLIFDKTTPEVCELVIAAGDTVKDLHHLIVEVTAAYLLDANGDHIPLVNVDKVELERIKPGWREDEQQPERYMIEDKTIEFDAAADADYTLRLEVYRLPLSALVAPSDEPEIAAVHHDKLLEWVCHEFYSARDEKTHSPELAALHERGFEDYFGLRPNVDLQAQDLVKQAATQQTVVTVMNLEALVSRVKNIVQDISYTEDDIIELLNEAALVIAEQVTAPRSQYRLSRGVNGGGCAPGGSANRLSPLAVSLHGRHEAGECPEQPRRAADGLRRQPCQYWRCLRMLLPRA